MPDILSLGELLIDFCATQLDVPVAEALAFTKAPGGAPANVAVAARRLGARSGFLGAVGDDPFGAFLADVLRREGVETDGLAKVAGLKTPLAFVAFRSDGAADFFFYHDRGLAPLTEEHISEGLLAGAAALHFGSISRIEPAARAATDKARRLARQHKLLVSYDPNYRPRLWGEPEEARRRIAEGFDGCTVAKVSREEWGFVMGDDDFAAGARRLLDRGVELVIRSEGGDGASFAARRGEGHVPAFRVPSVDFVGAGDAFVASVLVDLVGLGKAGAAVADLDLPELARIIRRANAVGALATTQAGAIPALPTRQQVDAFLAGQG